MSKLDKLISQYSMLWTDKIAESVAIQYANDQTAKYREALHDAIRRPMGVIPQSAEGLVSVEELDAAELRRPKHDTGES